MNELDWSVAIHTEGIAQIYPRVVLMMSKRYVHRIDAALKVEYRKGT